MNITRANMVKEYQNWGDVYTIEFDIIVTEIPPTSSSVFRFTAGNEDCCNKVDRIPALFVTQAGEFFIANTKMGAFVFAFELGKTYQITIRYFKECEKYWYEILIDGNSKFKIESTNPESFSNVKFYAGDPWHDPFSSDFGSICNVKIGIVLA